MRYRSILLATNIFPVDGVLSGFSGARLPPRLDGVRVYALWALRHTVGMSTRFRTMDARSSPVPQVERPLRTSNPSAVRLCRPRILHCAVSQRHHLKIQETAEADPCSLRHLAVLHASPRNDAALRCARFLRSWVSQWTALGKPEGRTQTLRLRHTVTSLPMLCSWPGVVDHTLKIAPNCRRGLPSSSRFRPWWQKEVQPISVGSWVPLVDVSM